MSQKPSYKPTVEPLEDRLLLNADNPTTSPPIDPVDQELHCITHDTHEVLNTTDATQPCRTRSDLEQELHTLQQQLTAAQNSGETQTIIAPVQLDFSHIPHNTTLANNSIIEDANGYRIKVHTGSGNNVIVHQTADGTIFFAGNGSDHLIITPQDSTTHSFEATQIITNQAGGGHLNVYSNSTAHFTNPFSSSGTATTIAGSLVDPINISLIVTSGQHGLRSPTFQYEQTVTVPPDTTELEAQINTLQDQIQHLDALDAAFIADNPTPDTSELDAQISSLQSQLSSLQQQLTAAQNSGETQTIIAPVQLDFSHIPHGTTLANHSIIEDANGYSIKIHTGSGNNVIVHQTADGTIFFAGNGADHLIITPQDSTTHSFEATQIITNQAGGGHLNVYSNSTAHFTNPFSSSGAATTIAGSLVDPINISLIVTSGQHGLKSPTFQYEQTVTVPPDTTALEAQITDLQQQIATLQQQRQAAQATPAGPRDFTTLLPADSSLQPLAATITQHEEMMQQPLTGGDLATQVDSHLTLYTDLSDTAHTLHALHLRSDELSTDDRRALTTLSTAVTEQLQTWQQRHSSLQAALTVLGPNHQTQAVNFTNDQLTSAHHAEIPLDIGGSVHVQTWQGHLPVTPAITVDNPTDLNTTGRATTLTFDTDQGLVQHVAFTPDIPTNGSATATAYHGTTPVATTTLTNGTPAEFTHQAGITHIVITHDITRDDRHLLHQGFNESFLHAQNVDLSTEAVASGSGTIMKTSVGDSWDARARSAAALDANADGDLTVTLDNYWSRNLQFGLGANHSNTPALYRFEIANDRSIQIFANGQQIGHVNDFNNGDTATIRLQGDQVLFELDGTIVAQADRHATALHLSADFAMHGSRIKNVAASWLTGTTETLHTATPVTLTDLNVTADTNATPITPTPLTAQNNRDLALITGNQWNDDLTPQEQTYQMQNNQLTTIGHAFSGPGRQYLGNYYPDQYQRYDVQSQNGTGSFTGLYYLTPGGLAPVPTSHYTITGTSLIIFPGAPKTLVAQATSSNSATIVLTEMNPDSIDGVQPPNQMMVKADILLIDSQARAEGIVPLTTESNRSHAVLVPGSTINLQTAITNTGAVGGAVTIDAYAGPTGTTADGKQKSFQTTLGPNESKGLSINLVAPPQSSASGHVYITLMVTLPDGSVQSFKSMGRLPSSSVTRSRDPDDGPGLLNDAEVTNADGETVHMSGVANYVVRGTSVEQDRQLLTIARRNYEAAQARQETGATYAFDNGQIDFAAAYAQASTAYAQARATLVASLPEEAPDSTVAQLPETLDDSQDVLEAMALMDEAMRDVTTHDQVLRAASEETIENMLNTGEISTEQLGNKHYVAAVTFVYEAPVFVSNSAYQVIEHDGEFHIMPMHRVFELLRDEDARLRFGSSLSIDEQQASSIATGYRDTMLKLHEELINNPWSWYQSSTAIPGHERLHTRTDTSAGQLVAGLLQQYWQHRGTPVADAIASKAKDLFGILPSFLENAANGSIDAFAFQVQEYFQSNGFHHIFSRPSQATSSETLPNGIRAWTDRSDYENGYVRVYFDTYLKYSDIDSPISHFTVDLMGTTLTLPSGNTLHSNLTGTHHLDVPVDQLVDGTDLSIAVTAHFTNSDVTLEATTQSFDIAWDGSESLPQGETRVGSFVLSDAALQAYTPEQIQQLQSILDFGNLDNLEAGSRAIIEKLVNDYFNVTSEDQLTFESATSFIGRLHGTGSHECKHWLQEDVIFSATDVWVGNNITVDNPTAKWHDADGVNQVDYKSPEENFQEFIESNDVLAGDVIQFYNGYPHTMVVGQVTGEGMWVFDTNFGDLGEYLEVESSVATHMRNPNNANEFITADEAALLGIQEIELTHAWQSDNTVRYHFITWDRVNSATAASIYRVSHNNQ